MFNVSEIVAAGNGLEVFDSGLLVALAVVVGWCFWHRPRATVLVLAAVMMWFQAGPGAPVWPWLVAIVWGLLRGVGWLARLFMVGSRLR